MNPAYFGSWFPFPDNSDLDWDAIGEVDYLFVSHLHRDHFDPEHLRAHVSKKATVLLPQYPTTELEDALREIGFTSFVTPPSGEPVDVLTGFISSNDEALGRPVGVVIDRTGSLLVADDGGNTIWRVTAAGSQAELRH